ncbi:hypothetical protein CAEBREN_00471 [Caenorhabditis brenneri]|uniref:Uncharacterized protein n=1 Tax=Caenorhabditis brenneri TaxID=135651 RepID=G0MVG9_CAEBE|nr:hypothetical protein CAEBREN_00471 [Caenorhabditis brenneri]
MTIVLTDSHVTKTEVTLFNVKLRPGCNPKIDNEIRREIQKQLDGYPGMSNKN